MHYYAYTQPVLLDVPIAYGRSYPIFSFGKDSVHPFVLAVREAEKSDKPKFIIQKVLENYYLRFQPETAAQFFDIHSNHLFDKNPPWAVVMPWMNMSIEEWKLVQKKSVWAENNQSKTKLKIDIYLIFLAHYRQNTIGRSLCLNPLRQRLAQLRHRAKQCRPIHLLVILHQEPI